ncbi:hypothetical protein [Streptomyces xanthochromogenes]|uniref:hypothetical protein n=1 Tax=Streptomyces xanthochromogenes TaxID=67384 RepID=UPI00167897E4|nr:hypothetical protein [Streptomyces xanthochromogenes]
MVIEVENYLAQHPAEERPLLPLVELLKGGAAHKDPCRCPRVLSAGVVVDDDQRALCLFRAPKFVWRPCAEELEQPPNLISGAYAAVVDATGLEGIWAPSRQLNPLSIDISNVPMDAAPCEVSWVSYTFSYLLRFPGSGSSNFPNGSVSARWTPLERLSVSRLNRRLAGATRRRFPDLKTVPISDLR